MKVFINAIGIKGLVVRPGCVYGKQGKLTSIWFEGAYKEKALRQRGFVDEIATCFDSWKAYQT